MKRWFALTLATALLMLAGQAVAADASYVGSDACADCHDAVSATHSDSLHGQAWAAMNEKYGNAGCESCHGPGSVHVDTNAKADIISFGKGAARDATAQSDPCLNCHTTSTELSMWDISQHNGETACSDCHNVHSAPAPKVNQNEICFECHKDVRFDANRQSHHPIIEGKVSCSDCHNPHGTMEDSMVSADSRNQLCYKCHAEKRGPFIWEHPPVEEDCGICHESHGSRYNKLLTTKTPNLCQDCHDWSRHPGTPYDNAAGFSGEDASHYLIARDCMNCHSNIHGSNAPGTQGKRFTY